LKVLANDQDITPKVRGSPEVLAATLPVPVAEANADDWRFVFEIWDRPDRRYSFLRPRSAAANRTRLELTGRGLLDLSEVRRVVDPSSMRSRRRAQENPARAKR
jgi:hypothetical protein